MKTIVCVLTCLFIASCGARSEKKEHSRQAEPVVNTPTPPENPSSDHATPPLPTNSFSDQSAPLPASPSPDQLLAAIKPFQQQIPADLDTVAETDPWLDPEGGMTSNGGQGVDCENGQLVLLDHYEAVNQWNVKLDLGPAQMSWQDKVKYVLYRLAVRDDVRARRYLAHLTFFQKHAQFVDGYLDILPDNNGTVVKAGCKVVQMAQRRKPQFSTDSLYTISLPMWDRLDESSKAGLVLHEIILNEAVDWGHITTRKTRYFNANISSKDFLKIQPDQYTKLLFSSEIFPLALTQVGKFFIVKNNSSVDERMGTISGEVYQVSYAKLGEKFNGAVIPLAFGSVWATHVTVSKKTSQLKKALFKSFHFCVPEPMRSSGTQITKCVDAVQRAEGDFVEFSDSGFPSAISFLDSYRIEVKNSNKAIKFINGVNTDFRYVKYDKIVPLSGKAGILFYDGTAVPMEFRIEIGAQAVSFGIWEDLWPQQLNVLVGVVGSVPVSLHRNGSFKTFTIGHPMRLRLVTGEFQDFAAGTAINLEEQERVILKP